VLLVTSENSSCEDGPLALDREAVVHGKEKTLLDRGRKLHASNQLRYEF
jgi:hypothetical protein